MRSHRSEFQKLAGEKESEGDPDFKDLIREMEERDDLKSQLGHDAGPSRTRTAAPEHSHEPQPETSHEGHTPDQFSKIAKRDDDPPHEGVNESAQRDTPAKQDSTSRATPPPGLSTSQPGSAPPQAAVSPQSQSLPQGSQAPQEGETVQNQPYRQYYIHDLDTPAGGSSQASATDRPSEQQGPASERPSGPGYEREGGHRHDGRRVEDGTEIGETSAQRSMGGQSGAAETARAQAMFARTDGPSDRGAPGPFAGA